MESLSFRNKKGSADCTIKVADPYTKIFQSQFRRNVKLEGISNHKRILWLTIFSIHRPFALVSTFFIPLLMSVRKLKSLIIIHFCTACTLNPGTQLGLLKGGRLTVKWGHFQIFPSSDWFKTGFPARKMRQNS